MVQSKITTCLADPILITEKNTNREKALKPLFLLRYVLKKSDLLKLITF